MKVVIAIDSLKGSLTSLEAGDAIRAGVRKADPKAQIIVRPLADGGEGTVEALTLGMGGTLQNTEVTGSLGERVVAQYGILNDGQTAVMEMSAAAGITLVPEQKRNPLNTTTYGVGEMIRDAIKKGGVYPAAANGANEAAVSLFLNDKIRFYEIPFVVREAMEKASQIKDISLDDIFEADKTARNYVLEHIK